MTNHAALRHRVCLFVAIWLTVPAMARAEGVGDEQQLPYYDLAMAGAYIVAPVLGIGSGVTLGPRVGVPVFLLTPPIVHLAYADPWWSLASLFGASVSTVGTSLLMIVLSQCSLGIGLGGNGTCGGPGTLGAIAGYVAWSAFDVTMSSLRTTRRLHDNSKRSPRPVHEPSTPTAPRTATVGACFIERSHDEPRG